MAALGGAGILFVLTTGHQYFPDQTIQRGAGGTITTINWPDPAHGWFLNPNWFQPQTVDISAVALVVLFTGLGILSYAMLYYPWSRGRLTPVATSMIVRLSLVVAGALVLAYLTLFTFSNQYTTGLPAGGAAENVVLGLALGLVLFALQVWMLPVMTAPGNRQRFMPSIYLHAVMLLQSVAAPLLVIFVALYPVVNWLYSVNLNDGYWVQCAVKSDVPNSCTFTPYIGYIIAGVVSGMLFTFVVAAGYLWNRKPAFVRSGATFSFVFCALAVLVTHDTDPVNFPFETPIALVLAIAIAILGVAWTMSTQREFVPAEMRNVALGCTGQWLVMGTLLAAYIGGFALFSFADFLDTEQNLIIFSGAHTIHDAYWVLLICIALAAIQFAFLMRRDPLGQVRKFALWLVLIGGGMQVVAAINFNPADSNNYANTPYYIGVAIVLLGVLVSLYGAFRSGSVGLAIVSFVFAAVGAVGAIVCSTLTPIPSDVLVAFTIFGGTGAVLYTIFGKDAPDPFLQRGVLARRSPTTVEPGLPE